MPCYHMGPTKWTSVLHHGGGILTAHGTNKMDHCTAGGRYSHYTWDQQNGPLFCKGLVFSLHMGPTKWTSVLQGGGILSPRNILYSTTTIYCTVHICICGIYYKYFREILVENISVFSAGQVDQLQRSYSN